MLISEVESMWNIFINSSGIHVKVKAGQFDGCATRKKILKYGMNVLVIVL